VDPIGSSMSWIACLVHRSVACYVLDVSFSIVTNPRNQSACLMLMFGA